MKREAWGKESEFMHVNAIDAMSKTNAIPIPKEARRPWTGVIMRKGITMAIIRNTGQA